MIDWYQDDGVNLPMINDHVRNRFYDDMLRSVVRDKNCTEIGFGTGLLSMILLKNGAKHVLAYEKDIDRHNLGQEIIEKCGLIDRIKLINEEYHHGMHDENRITVSEIISDNLWSEGLWKCLPRVPSKNFLPSRFAVKIFSFQLPGNLFDLNNLFSPGVQIDKKFISVINQIISRDSSQKQLTDFKQLIQNYADKLLRKMLMQHRVPKLLGGYEIDISQKTLSVTDLSGTNIQELDFSNESTSIHLDVSHMTLIYPTISFGDQNQHWLELEQTFCWAAPPSPYINIDHKKITFNHNFLHGEIQLFFQK